LLITFRLLCYAEGEEGGLIEEKEHSTVVPSILVRPERSKKAVVDACPQVMVRLCQSKLGLKKTSSHKGYGLDCRETHFGNIKVIESII
jgi:hypothetical protein